MEWIANGLFWTLENLPSVFMHQTNGIIYSTFSRSTPSLPSKTMTSRHFISVCNCFRRVLLLYYIFMNDCLCISTSLPMRETSLNKGLNWNSKFSEHASSTTCHVVGCLSFFLCPNSNPQILHSLSFRTSNGVLQEIWEQLTLFVKKKKLKIYLFNLAFNLHYLY